MQINPLLLESLETRTLLAAIDSDSSETPSETLIDLDFSSSTDLDNTVPAHNSDPEHSTGEYIIMGQFIFLITGCSASAAATILSSCTSLHTGEYKEAAGLMALSLIPITTSGFFLYELFPFWNNPESYTTSVIAWSLAGASFIATAGIGALTLPIWMKLLHSDNPSPSAV